MTFSQAEARTMILCHGYGGNAQIEQAVKSSGIVNARLVSFNFPDHDLKERGLLPEEMTFGTLNELLPAFEVLKREVIDGKLDAIDLYGFSAGGGVVVNLIAILNTGRFKSELSEIGIGDEQRELLLCAIQKGVVILDVPLKSVEEIVAFRGASPESDVLVQNYQKNCLRPIDSLYCLDGLKLNVVLNFQENDEILSNRDDQLYIERLKWANRCGTTTVIIGNDGGHLFPHNSLWKAYSYQIK